MLTKPTNLKSTSKQNSLLLLALAGVLVILLAMSIPNLVLAPGQPFSLEQAQSGGTGTNGPFPGSSVLEVMFRGVLALALIMLPLYILYSLSTSEGRQRLIADVVLIVVLLLVADYVHHHPLNPSDQQQEQAAFSPLDLGSQISSPTAFFAANPPAWLSLVIVLLISLLAVTAILVLIWFLRRQSKTSDTSLEKIVEAAQGTIASLQAGEDFEVSIVRCYQEMSRVIEAEKRIARDSAMTPREFEEQLIRKGLPQDAIQILTRLFEQVRYGGISPTGREISLALSSLTDIVNACADHEVQ